MSEKIFNTRIVHKHDTAENWAKAVNFVPKAGELIIYDADENYNYPRTKIGDGVRVVEELPFIENQADWNQNDTTALDFVKNKPVVNGIGKYSTCLHTGPIDAASKYQVVAGKYNQLDGGYTKETSSTTWWPAIGGAQEQFTIITEPIFDSAKGNFKAQVTGKATGLAVGDFFLRANEGNYEIGQELTLIKYYKCTKFGSSIGATIYEIQDNTDTIGKYAVIVGNGNSENDRSNAYALDWDGNGYYSGKVYVGENKEELARLNKVPHYYEEENFSTNGLVNFVVKNSSYLEYQTEKYLSGTQPYKDTMPDSLYRVIIDNEAYEVVTDKYGALQTVSSTSELVNKGDFIISNRMLMYSTGESYSYKVIQLPNLDGEQHSVEVIYLNKLMVPEEIIPDTIARKADLDNLVLITIEDIDAICGSITPISEVLF